MGADGVAKHRWVSSVEVLREVGGGFYKGHVLFFADRGKTNVSDSSSSSYVCCFALNPIGKTKFFQRWRCLLRACQNMVVPYVAT